MVDRTLVAKLPLQRWIQDEEKRNLLEQRMAKGPEQMMTLKKQSILRKTTVAYGIVELLIEAPLRRVAVGLDPGDVFGLDNFVVHVTRHVQAMGYPAQTPWNDVTGVSSVTPGLTAELAEPSYISNIADDNIQGRMGRYLEVQMSNSKGLLPSIAAGSSVDPDNTNNDCRSFGIILYELYTACPFSAGKVGGARGSSPAMSPQAGSHEDPARKVRYDKKKGKSYLPLGTMRQTRVFTTLQDLGYPSSLCMLVQNLVDCRGVYPSLNAAKDDLHLLLRDPGCFLFDPGDKGTQLNFKRGKLYGREEEVTSITEAFCRVSSAENAAYFIGGYSGSGKSMLVHSLTARVDVAGGFVLTQKVDQMTKERPLLGILSAFDKLCLLIWRKCSEQELLDMSSKLESEFETDFPVLARLMPNVNHLLPQIGKAAKTSDSEKLSNLHNVCFTLKRFVRIVSSRFRPVMLFLDDLQWAASTTLELIEALLLDTMGPSCFFFVGSYRDNEVGRDHPLSDTMARLKSSPLHTTSIILEGLKREDVNWMVAETLGIVPRLCKCLSDIVFRKSDGNPLFSKEFLRSLVDSRLLKYTLRERRWIWDEGKIEGEKVTKNVLYLLSSKMASLLEDIQTALRLMACFGVNTEKMIIACLSSAPEYSRLGDWLNQAIDEGFIHETDSGFKFVHDKVQEAAYMMVQDKQQFHYNLGKLLFSTSKGHLDDIIFHIVPQFNHGKSLIEPELQMDVARLNLKAGSRAMDRSDFQTAQTYLEEASSLLEQHQNLWRDNYELSLRLYFLKAKSAYLCGDREKAYQLLKTLLDNGRVMEDKLDAYYLYAHLLHACEESDEAYTTCCEVLSQLNELVPDTLNPKKLMNMMKETAVSFSSISYDNLLEMKQMGPKLRFTLKFLSLLHIVCFWKKPEMMAYIGCRMIHLTLQHGVCEESVVGLMQYASLICHRCESGSEIQNACHVAKAAMRLFKQQYNSPETISKVYPIYYGFIAHHTQPIQTCSLNLRKGFECGMSSGESIAAFFNSMRHLSTGLIGGDNLPSLLKEADSYIEMSTQLHQRLSVPHFRAWRESISILIDKGQDTIYCHASGNASEENLSTNAAYAQQQNRAIYFNKIIQSFWLGHSQRCDHYVNVALKMCSYGGLTKLCILFYATLNAFRGIKNKNGNGSRFIKARNLYKTAIPHLRNAAELCPWNFSNKVFLLEAEFYSLEKKSELAKSSYSAAITSSKSSRFLHETGLACELAAIHNTKNGEVRIALDLFKQAKECYSQWGSKMKVESITQQTEKLLSMSLMKGNRFRPS